MRAMMLLFFLLALSGCDQQPAKPPRPHTDEQAATPTPPESDKKQESDSSPPLQGY